MEDSAAPPSDEFMVVAAAVDLGSLVGVLCILIQFVRRVVMSSATRTPMLWTSLLMFLLSVFYIVLQTMVHSTVVPATWFTAHYCTVVLNLVTPVYYGVRTLLYWLLSFRVQQVFDGSTFAASRRGCCVCCRPAVSTMHRFRVVSLLTTILFSGAFAITLPEMVASTADTHGASVAYCFPKELPDLALLLIFVYVVIDFFFSFWLLCVFIHNLGRLLALPTSAPNGADIVDVITKSATLAVTAIVSTNLHLFAVAAYAPNSYFGAADNFINCLSVACLFAGFQPVYRHVFACVEPVVGLFVCCCTGRRRRRPKLPAKPKLDLVANSDTISPTSSTGAAASASMFSSATTRSTVSSLKLSAEQARQRRMDMRSFATLEVSADVIVVSLGLGEEVEEEVVEPEAEVAVGSVPL